MSYRIKNPHEDQVLWYDALSFDDALVFNFPCGVCGIGDHDPMFTLSHSLALRNQVI